MTGEAPEMVREERRPRDVRRRATEEKKRSKKAQYCLSFCFMGMVWFLFFSFAGSDD